MLLRAQGQFKWLHTDAFALPTIYWQNEDKLKKISQIICWFEEDRDYVLYLELHSNNDGGTNKDMECWLSKAKATFNRLRKVWSSKQLRKRTRVNPYSAVLLCASWDIENEYTKVNKTGGEGSHYRQE